MSATLPAAEPLKSPPRIMGPAVKLTGGPYNGLKGNLQKQSLPTGPDWDSQPSAPISQLCSIVIEFEHAWFEIVTEHQWLAPLNQAPA